MVLMCINNYLINTYVMIRRILWLFVVEYVGKLIEKIRVRL